MSYTNIIQPLKLKKNNNISNSAKSILFNLSSMRSFSKIIGLRKSGWQQLLQSWDWDFKIVLSRRWSASLHNCSKSWSVSAVYTETSANTASDKRLKFLTVCDTGKTPPCRCLISVHQFCATSENCSALLHKPWARETRNAYSHNKKRIQRNQMKLKSGLGVS